MMVETVLSISERQSALEQLKQICEAIGERMFFIENTFNTSIISISPLHIVMVFSNGSVDDIKIFIQEHYTS